jgi:hypothetical protein
VLFETTRNENALWGDRASFDEVYTLNEKGKPVRKAAVAGGSGES